MRNLRSTINKILKDIKCLKCAIQELVEGGGSGGIQSIQEGTNITVDNTDPLNPIVSSIGGELEKITEGANTGYVIKGKDPLAIGPIGDNSINLSAPPSGTQTPSDVYGATGLRSFVTNAVNNIASGTRSSTFGSNNLTAGNEAITGGNNNINKSNTSLVMGLNNQLIPTEGQSSSANIVSGEENIVYGYPWSNIVSGWENISGTEGATQPNGNLAQSSIITGRRNVSYAGTGNGTIGGALLNGASFCTVVGFANEDVTAVPGTTFTGTWNDTSNPRFVVGVGAFNVASMTGTRRNGFVVMGNGTVTAPSLTTTLIDAEATGKVLVTKEYLHRKQIKTIADDTYTLLESDWNKILHFTSATDVTITVPTGLSVGNRYEGKQRGDGQLIFVDDGTTVINIGASETNKTLEKFSVWGLDCVASDEYDLFGKLELV